MEILPLPSSNEKPITNVVRYLDEQPAVIVKAMAGQAKVALWGTTTAGCEAA